MGGDLGVKGAGGEEIQEDGIKKAVGEQRNSRKKSFLRIIKQSGTTVLPGKYLVNLLFPFILISQKNSEKFIIVLGMI